MARIIQGTRTVEGCRVSVVDGDGNGKLLDPRFDLERHSPAGFEWGYGGSGPAQLALAILAEITQDDQVALGLYQDFKWQLVSGIQNDEWILFEDNVWSWIRNYKLHRATGQPDCN